MIGDMRERIFCTTIEEQVYRKKCLERIYKKSARRTDCSKTFNINK